MWRNYWPIYERLEEEVIGLTFQIALTDKQLKVYSLGISNLLTRCCIEVENASKRIVLHKIIAAGNGRSSRGIEGLNFSQIGGILCTRDPIQKKSVRIIWPYQKLTQKNEICKPFVKLEPWETWKEFNKRECLAKNPDWYNAYNKIKHDRDNFLERGNYGNLLNALAGLFILNLWLRQDDIEMCKEWINFARKRIKSYSKFFSSEGLLEIKNNGVLGNQIVLTKGES